MTQDDKTRLGASIPYMNKHGVSVSLPTWADVVGYEEGKKEVIDKLKNGYPRFVRHPLVVDLVNYIQKTYFSEYNPDEWKFMALPTESSANQLDAYLKSEFPDQIISIRNIHNIVYIVRFPSALEIKANKFWQHTGEMIASRHAEKIFQCLEDFEKKNIVPNQDLIVLRNSSTHIKLKERLAGLYYGQENEKVHSNDIFLYPCGMNAIFASIKLIQETKKQKIVLFGFPYLDTLKILQEKLWCPSGYHFFPTCTASDMEKLAELFKTDDIAAIITEFPGNPLLSVPDIKKLASLAHMNDAVLIVDDTIGSFNVNVMQNSTADIAVTSLSKLFSGTCTALGGSIALNPTSKNYELLSNHLTNKNNTFLVEEDAAVIYEASLDLEQRLRQVNEAASIIAKRLLNHPLVRSVYYPEIDATNSERYNSYLRDGIDPSISHYGPLLSLVLHGGRKEAEIFYDSLMIAKGPSLGTNFTLCCPYTIIAHYYELDYVESCGVDRHLVRISIGTEPVEETWKDIHNALAQVELASK